MSSIKENRKHNINKKQNIEEYNKQYVILHNNTEFCKIDTQKQRVTSYTISELIELPKPDAYLKYSSID